jgi:hypothetical protein
MNKGVPVMPALPKDSSSQNASIPQWGSSKTGSALPMGSLLQTVSTSQKVVNQISKNGSPNLSRSMSPGVLNNDSQMLRAQTKMMEEWIMQNKNMMDAQNKIIETLTLRVDKAEQIIGLQNERIEQLVKNNNVLTTNVNSIYQENDEYKIAIYNELQKINEAIPMYEIKQSKCGSKDAQIGGIKYKTDILTEESISCLTENEIDKAIAAMRTAKTRSKNQNNTKEMEIIQTNVKIMIAEKTKRFPKKKRDI